MYAPFEQSRIEAEMRQILGIVSSWRPMPNGMQMQKPLNLLAYAAIYQDHQVIKEKLSFLTLHKLRFFVKNCGKTVVTSIRTHPLVWIMFAISEQYSGKLEICATHSAHRSESLT